ncbi:MAG TPA: GNAT family N-acetyltransferase [Chitinophagaceae bacterium]|nr:GNAT family N-acetyltransferase [Chitinophagaceae bacterium]
MEEKPVITNNEAQHRFETIQNDEVAFLEYRFYKKDIALMHTLVPKALEGRGIASALAVYAFDYARQYNMPVMVYCPFVAAFLKKHPEYNVQVDKNYVK